MARPAAAAPVNNRYRADLLLALFAGVEMQVELLFAEGGRGDLLFARGLMLMLTIAVAPHRRAPLIAVALARTCSPVSSCSPTASSTT
jgi:hypothetical protein